MRIDVSFVRFFRAAGLGLLATATALAIAAMAATAQTAPTQAQVTFTKDVAPIFYRSCVRCHRPDEIAPMSLLTYNDARPWARAIKERVSKREMPPWFLDKTLGIQKYQNDPSLTDEEIATIVKWVDGGALQGNPADMPPMPAQEDITTWRIGQPDLVIKYPTFKVPARGPDLYGTLDAPFGTAEDRYIKAIQSRVVDGSSRKIVHHALSYAVEPGDNADGGDDSGGGSGLFLVEYASGKNATFYPRGYVPKHIQWSKQLGQEAATDIDIPANSIVRRDGYTRLNSAARIIAWQPHMHIRGKYQCLELIYPSEPVKTETVTCARWNYNWHTIYNYDPSVAPVVPAGTLLHVISWWDNTTSNRFNPDPKNWVGAGTGRTIDEMGFSWIGWYDLTDEEYKAELAARKAGPAKDRPATGASAALSEARP